MALPATRSSSLTSRPPASFPTHWPLISASGDAVGRCAPGPPSSCLSNPRGMTAADADARQAPAAAAAMSPIRAVRLRRCLLADMGALLPGDYGGLDGSCHENVCRLWQKRWDEWAKWTD